MNAIELIKYHEKYRRFPYRCTAGKLTIGYGWNLDDNGITEDQASYILAGQARSAEVMLSASPPKTETAHWPCSSWPKNWVAARRC